MKTTPASESALGHSAALVGSASRRALRVVTSLPGRGKNTNPYLLQLLDALERQPDAVQTRYFSWRAAIFGGYDLLHIHWPERLIRGSSAHATLARRVLCLALLARLTVTRTSIVRTLHNLSSHESGDPVERLLLNAIDRRTVLWIRLNPYTPVPRGAEVRTILHGHYRDWFVSRDETNSIAGRVLFFGLLRPYKGIDELVTAFMSVSDPSITLRIVGSAQDSELRAVIADAEAEDGRISSRIEYVGDPELAREIGAAQLVVLPYRAVHNSGAALLALSLGRPVLMPAADTTTWLQDEVGADWVITYDGALTRRVIVDALQKSANRAGTAPDLTARDWAPIADAHVDAYRAAAGDRQRIRHAVDRRAEMDID